MVEDSISGIAGGKAANMRVAAIPDCRFVDPHEHKTPSDYVLVNLFEIPRSSGGSKLRAE